MTERPPRPRPRTPSPRVLARRRRRRGGSRPDAGIPGPRRGRIGGRRGVAAPDPEGRVRGSYQFRRHLPSPKFAARNFDDDGTAASGRGVGGLVRPLVAMIWPGEGRRQRPDQTGGNGRDVALPWCAPRCRSRAPALESVETMEPSTRGSSRRGRGGAARGPLSSNHSFTAKVAVMAALRVQCAVPSPQQVCGATGSGLRTISRRCTCDGAFQAGCRSSVLLRHTGRARARICCPTGLDYPGSAMRIDRQHHFFTLFLVFESTLLFYWLAGHKHRGRLQLDSKVGRLGKLSCTSSLRLTPSRRFRVSFISSKIPKEISESSRGGSLSAAA